MVYGVQVLCLHLKRFRWSLYFRAKVDTYVEFPLSGLNMNHYVLNNLVLYCIAHILFIMLRFNPVIFCLSFSTSANVTKLCRHIVHSTTVRIIEALTGSGKPNHIGT